MEVVHQIGLAGHPVDGVLQGHSPLFSNPVAQQSGAVVGTVPLIRPSAAMRNNTATNSVSLSGGLHQLDRIRAMLSEGPAVSA